MMTIEHHPAARYDWMTKVDVTYLGSCRHAVVNQSVECHDTDGEAGDR